MKTLKWMNVAAWVLWGVELAAVVVAFVMVGISGLLPIEYWLFLIAYTLLCAGFHLLFLFAPRAKCSMRALSMVLSVIVLIVSLFGSYLVGVVHGSLSGMDGDDVGGGDNEPFVPPLQADVTVEPFVVYLSGLGLDDNSATDYIADKGLSDVNMLIVVNPKTAKILMVNTPRDYYVPLMGDSAKMDKLTHAGSYGTEASMETLSALYNVNINYYVKVNFKSVVDIVDAVGGVTVVSDYNFSSPHSYSGKVHTFVKGENQMDGDKALTFCRERDSFYNGDLQRGLHQQKVIRAVADKILTVETLMSGRLQTLLDAILGNIKTNISRDEITSLVRFQLSKMPNWQFETYAVSGYGDMCPSYAAGGLNLSVVVPDYDTVEEAKGLLAAALSNP